ncbi:MAG: glycosyltransferase family 2 protein [Proteobacteria bacterium]|nr:glycosyltransferase family 2 protein [Pseudomonadota bacterium]
MRYDKKIAVVIPAFNEERQILKVLETMPDFVDAMVVVDDCSRDRTVEVVERHRTERDERVVLIRHETNRGVGAAIGAGYKWVRDNAYDVAVVMAGDFQMDPADLDKIVRPVARGRAEYSKGNRLFTGDAWRQIPKIRYFGNSALSLLTKLASGYWHVADSQCGYTAISLRALRRLDLDAIYARYGMPNDFLVKLNIAGCRVVDVAVKPVYRVGERSGIRIRRVVFTIGFLLWRLFWRRMFQKYVIRDFHPLLFFYLMSLVLIPLGLLLGVLIVVFNTPLFGASRPLETGYLILCALLLITGLQSLFFGMWFDMEQNRHLFVYEYDDEDESERG